MVSGCSWVGSSANGPETQRCSFLVLSGVTIYRIYMVTPWHGIFCCDLFNCFLCANALGWCPWNSTRVIYVECCRTDCNGTKHTSTPKPVVELLLAQSQLFSSLHSWVITKKSKKSINNICASLITKYYRSWSDHVGHWYYYKWAIAKWLVKHPW